jgi:Fe2+ or Zn2+ uptake regulation protein
VKTVDELTDLFRLRGLKVTPQRQCIFRALHAMEGTHPSAEAVHAAVVGELPTVSLKTVYQTLNDLVAMGELRHLELGAGPARFDVNTDTHQHLACQGCGRTWDVYADLSQLHVPDAAAGFSVSTTDVVFRGFCVTCAPAGHLDLQQPTAEASASART